MSVRAQPRLASVVPPPIEQALGWVEGRRFPADKPLIDLCQAVPAYPPPPEMLEHMAQALKRPETHRYGDPSGLPELRAALAADINRSYAAASVGTENVLITAGCNQAFCLATLGLAEAGDGIVLPLPCYFNHLQWLQMNGIDARHVPFRPEAGGLPDLDAVASAIGPKTRALVLISPNNPTGAVYPDACLNAAFELCRDAGVALVLDETYRDFLPEDRAPHSLFRRPDWASTLVHLYSFSKVFCLTGHRVGAIVGDAALLGEIRKAMDCVAICAPRLGQIGATFGLQQLRDWRAANTAKMRARLAALEQTLGGANGYRLVSAGAYFAYVRHPHEGMSSEAVARRLAERQNLLALPGSIFGPDQDAYLRLAFANADAAAMPEIATRLAADAAERF